MNTIFLRTGLLLLLLASLIGCAGNRHYPFKGNTDHNIRSDNFKRSIQLPWSDDGNCVVREASNEWAVLVERCFYALDFQKIRFEASTGNCAAYAEYMTALGTCLLAAVPALETSVALARMAGPRIAVFPAATVALAPAAPVLIVAGVIVVGVIVAPRIAEAIIEAAEYLQENPPALLADPERSKPRRQVETGSKPNPKPDLSPKDRSSPDLFPIPNNPENKKEDKKSGRIYVTYWKLNQKNNRRYAGRTSMAVALDFNKCHHMQDQAEEAIRQRDKNHHVEDENLEPKDPAFTVARYDKHDCGKAIDYNLRHGDQAYLRIRGREQMLIDSFGGAWSDTGKPYKTENKIRGVAKDSKDGRRFYDAARNAWGNEFDGKEVKYTGDN